MSREYVTVKRIQNAKRLVNHYVMLKKREKEIEAELKAIKRSIQYLYCMDVYDDEKILLEGSKKDLEAGAFSTTRKIEKKEKCFKLLHPALVWDCLEFSVPAVEKALSTPDFETVVSDLYGEHRVFRMKKKSDYSHIQPTKRVPNLKDVLVQQ